MKKGLKYFFIYFLILAAVVAFFVLSGIYNPLPKTKVYEIDNMKLSDMVVLEDGRIQTYSEDSYIELSGINSYVKSITISSNIASNTKKIYYTDNHLFAAFSENKTIKTNGNIVDLNKIIFNLRIDLSDKTGETFSLENISIDRIDYFADFLNVSFLVLIGYILILILIRLRIKTRSTETPRSKKSGWRYELVQYMPLVKNLITKDIKIKYRRSVLGVLWSVLNPLLMMIILTIVFSNIFRIKVENFPIYYLSGVTLWTLFLEGSTGAMNSVAAVGPLISKVYIPKYIFPLEKIVFSLVNFAFSLVAVLIVTLALQFPLTWTALLLIIPIIYVLIFATGIGLMLSAVSIFFKDVVHLYGVLTTAWMYLTPILYPVDILGSQVKAILSFNPMYHYVLYFRNLYMYNTIPDLKANLICILFALISLAIGITVFRKYQDRLILHL